MLYPGGFGMFESSDGYYSQYLAALRWLTATGNLAQPQAPAQAWLTSPAFPWKALSHEPSILLVSPLLPCAGIASRCKLLLQLCHFLLQIVCPFLFDSPACLHCEAIFLSPSLVSVSSVLTDLLRAVVSGQVTSHGQRNARGGPQAPLLQLTGALLSSDRLLAVCARS